MNKLNIEKIIQNTEHCYDGFFKLKKHRVQYQKFDGSQSRVHNREVLVREPTVAILIYDRTIDSVLLTEQFRIGPLENHVNPWIFELPAGIVESGEDKHEAIIREVKEETGYDCTPRQLIGEFYLSPGGTNEVTTLYFSEVQLHASGMHGAMGENEDIRTHIVPFSDACIMMQSGTISATTGIALMWLKSQKLSNEAKHADQ